MFSGGINTGQMSKEEKNIKVSVIVPVYNSEQYLETCLKSLLFQTLRDIEVICVDDGSTDAPVRF